MVIAMVSNVDGVVQNQPKTRELVVTKIDEHPPRVKSMTMLMIKIEKLNLIEM